MENLKAIDLNQAVNDFYKKSDSELCEVRVVGVMMEAESLSGGVLYADRLIFMNGEVVRVSHNRRQSFQGI